MKNGQFRFIFIFTSLVSRRKLLLYLIPLLLCAVTIGFLIQQRTHKNLNLRPKIQPQELKLWEQPNLLNLNHFIWIMVNKSRCKPNPLYPKNTHLLPVLVHSSRNHFKERLVIRNSWGSVPLYKKWDLRLVFLLGEQKLKNSLKINENLIKEQQLFGDLVIGSFKDSYKNMTYKHMMGYKWVLNFCNKASFVLKVDDDIFLDILTWLDWRSEDIEKGEKIRMEKIPDLYCHTFNGTKPIRNITTKWYVSEKVWPDEYYPDYCAGAGYGITVDLIKKLYSVSNNLKMFWIDDVFVTGVLVEYLRKISGWTWAPVYKHLWGKVTIDKDKFRDFCDNGDWSAEREFRAMAYVPRGNLFERDMMCMWNKTLYDKLFKWSD